MRARFAVPALVALLLTACGGSDDVATAPTTSPPSTTPPEPGLVIDTDVAADDLVALLYLFGQPGVDLRAVTVSGTGEVTCPRGREIVLGLLEATGRSGVEVGCGTSTPVQGSRSFPADWRSAADAAYGLDLPDVTPSADPGAVAVLRDVAAEGRPVTLLTLGPLTNVAGALAAGVDLNAVVDRIVVMGGAVDVPGNVVPDGASSPLPAEWNLWVDPAAVDQVLRSGIPVTLVPLDATNTVPLDQSVVDLLGANVGAPSPTADRVLQLWGSNPMIVNEDAFLWDPLAAIAVTKPDLVPRVSDEVRVQVGDGSFAGSTRRSSAGIAVEIVTVPDARAVLEELVRGLTGTPAANPLQIPTTVAPVAEATVAFDGTTCTYTGPTELPEGNLRLTIAEGSVDGTILMVGHLATGTIEDAIAWSLAHPGESPPMVDGMATVGAGGLPSPGDVTVMPGTSGVVCTVDGSVLAVAATLTVG